MQYSTLAGQTDNSLVSNNFGFLRLPLNFMPYESHADWVITGVPYDMAVSGRSGARFGPEAIRRASVNLAWEHRRFPWTFDVRERLNIIDCGDLVFLLATAGILSKNGSARRQITFFRQTLFEFGRRPFHYPPVVARPRPLFRQTRTDSF